MSRTRLLLVGPLPPPLGGATRHFRTLVDDLSRRDGLQVRVVNTSRRLLRVSRVRNLLGGLRSLVQFLCQLWKVDVVSYHASNRGMLAFGPFVVALSRLAGRPVMLRVFGGGFGDYCAGLGAAGRACARYLLRSSDAVLLQTRRSIDQLRSLTDGPLVWFPTHVRRPAPPPGGDSSRASGRERCRRFVFLGHLWKVKGIETILDAAGGLPQGCTIDVYGPQEDYSAAEIDERGAGVVRYCGVLSHGDVEARLWDYDCVVLPTFHPSEGYPGVIAEAYMHGIPVIATRWLAIPEIVDENSGLLIEPGDSAALAAAVARLHGDAVLWKRLQRGASDRAGQFDHDRWSLAFEQICRDLARLAA